MFDHRLGITEALRRIGATKLGGIFPQIAPVILPTMRVADLSELQAQVFPARGSFSQQSAQTTGLLFFLVKSQALGGILIESVEAISDDPGIGWYMEPWPTQPVLGGAHVYTQRAVFNLGDRRNPILSTAYIGPSQTFDIEGAYWATRQGVCASVLVNFNGNLNAVSRSLHAPGIWVPPGWWFAYVQEGAGEDLVTIRWREIPEAQAEESTAP